MDDAPDERRMRLRYAGTCRICGATLDARTEAIYERSLRTVRCLTCSPTDSPTEVPVEPGTAGASARREYERRRTRREDRIRTKHPKLGGLILALSDDPQSTTAWNSGALGEERLGQRLDQLASDTLRVLHDRRIPGTRANIDHLAVTPTGVYVIDAKRYVGQRPTLRIEGGLLRPRVESSWSAPGTGPSWSTECSSRSRSCGRSSVTLYLSRGVLCFIESDWPLIGGAFTTRGVEVLWPKNLGARLGAEGPHASAVSSVHQRLVVALSPA